jgi:hypothetical protein
MRVDTQRKPLGFQEVTSLKYRCVSFCVTRLTRSQQTLSHSLVFKTTEFLEQPSNTSLLQSAFCAWLVSITLSNAFISIA